MSKPQSTPQVITYATFLNFGKYKGMIARSVLQVDPRYIVWLNSETDYVVDQTLLNEAIEIESYSDPFDEEAHPYDNEF